MILLFLFGGLGPPHPPFFCHLVKVKLVFFLIYFYSGGSAPRTPRVFHPAVSDILILVIRGGGGRGTVLLTDS